MWLLYQENGYKPNNFESHNFLSARIKHIAITKCDLFFLYRNAKEIPFYHFCNIKLCAKHEITYEFHLHCWDHVCKVNEWCLVDYFHRGFRVSTEIMVYDYCTKCRTISAHSELIWTIILARSVKLSFTNIWFLCLNFVGCKPFLESKRIPFASSLETSASFYVFNWLYFVQCPTSFSSIYHLCLYVYFCMLFYLT